jgi:hypothetical protein
MYVEQSQRHHLPLMQRHSSCSWLAVFSGGGISSSQCSPFKLKQSDSTLVIKSPLGFVGSHRVRENNFLCEFRITLKRYTPRLANAMLFYALQKITPPIVRKPPPGNSRLYPKW